jgi:hypothetical protein
MRKNHPEYYITVKEMFKHLLSIYKNTNKLQQAKNNYRKLVIKNNNNYYSFLTEFLYLAEEAQVAKGDYKSNFMHKLSFKL